MILIFLQDQTLISFALQWQTSWLLVTGSDRLPAKLETDGTVDERKTDVWMYVIWAVALLVARQWTWTWVQRPRPGRGDPQAYAEHRHRSAVWRALLLSWRTRHTPAASRGVLPSGNWRVVLCWSTGEAQGFEDVVKGTLFTLCLVPESAVNAYIFLSKAVQGLVSWQVSHSAFPCADCSCW